MKQGELRTKIRKADIVRVISGKEKGKEGKVLKIHPVKQSVVVEGLNLSKRAIKPSQANPQGGIVEKEGRIHLSNVSLICGGCGKATRIGTKVLPDGKKLRVCKQCGELLDEKS